MASVKIVIALCVQAVLIQSAVSQCSGGVGPFGVNPVGYNGFPGPALVGPGFAGPAIVGPTIVGPAPGLPAPILPAPVYPTCANSAVSGGGFPVTCMSPLAPTGLSIVSENAIEGSLSVGGSLPFLGAVVLDGVMPSSGSGAVSYGCGNEAISIVEGPINTGVVGSVYGPGPIAGVVGPSFGPAHLGPQGFSSGIGPRLLGAPGFNGVGGCGCGNIH